MNEEQRVDFFVSYAGADVAWAEWVATVLEDGGFTTILQAWDFRPGSNFILDMHDALCRSDRVVPLLSEPYLRSTFAAPEWAAAFATDPRGHQRRLLPVRVGDCQPDGLLRAVVYVDLVGLEEPEAKGRLLAGVTEGRGRLGRGPFPGASSPLSQPFPGRFPAIWNVPDRNPNFAGRDAQLEQLRSNLARGTGEVAVLAVSGLGGVGKTQLGIEHSWRRAADYDLVWWVPAEVPATIAGSLVPLAEILGLPTDDPAAVVGLLHAELRQRHRWLVVLDNAEDPASVAAYLPRGGGGQVLITSRNPSWRARAVTMDLDVWSQPEAVAFLLARTGGVDEEAAGAVAVELGLLPLALEQAGAYVEETGMALDTYRALLVTRRGEMLERGTPAFYDRTVAATFGLAYDRAVCLSPAAAGVLGTAALLAPEDIPTELVAQVDPLGAEDAIASLRRLGLIRREDGSIFIHRLVGAVVRQRLGTEGTGSRAAVALTALVRAFPAPAQHHRGWPQSARLLPHVLALADHAPPTAQLGALLNSAGKYLWYRVQLRPACEVLELALRITASASGPDHPEVARTLIDLGLVLRDLGDLAGARERQEQALQLFEAAYGPDHPEVARSLTNLGVVLRHLGDLEGAHALHERALRIKEAAYGTDHPEVARSLTNLGVVMRRSGDLVGARALHERAAEVNEAAYGPDHPQVAVALTNLGRVLQDLGELASAREQHERALRIKELAYGPDHPEVAIALTNLGSALESVGELTRAREHLERALEIKEAAYGPNHPQVAITLNGLGSILQGLADPALAHGHRQRAVRILEAAYGPDHPDTREARAALDA